MSLLPHADEIGRAFDGSLRLIRGRPDALLPFDLTERGFLRSFLGLLLLAPAFIVTVAAARPELREGVGDAVLTAVTAVFFAIDWLALPLAMVPLCRALGLGRGYASFVTAYNWTSALVGNALMLPTALLLLGFSTPGLSALATLAILAVAARMRWCIAREALGASSAAAAGVVVLDITVSLASNTAYEAVLAALSSA